MVEDLLIRFWTNVADRIHGPFTFRFLLQPSMAALFAVRDGVSDARVGRLALDWAVFTHAAVRRRLLRDVGRSVGRIVVLGVAIDVVYQFIVFRWLYPSEAVFVVTCIVVVPYLLVRTAVSRGIRFSASRRSPPP